MYGHWLPGNVSAAHGEHGYSLSHSNELPHESRHRNNVHPTPRPTELHSRPSLHTTLTDTTGNLKLRQDCHPYHEHSFRENRLQRQSLPALRDVLPHETYSSSSPPVPAPWTTNVPASASRPTGVAPLNHRSVHPPMALPPPTPTDCRYPFDVSRGYKDTNIAASHQTQPYALPLYNAYSGPSQRYTDIPLETHSERTPAQPLPNAIPNASNLHSNTSPKAISSQSPAATMPQPSRDIAPPQSGAGNHGKLLRVETVPGDGEYYIYEDGHRCPTQIDGEQVNPAWGLTKANRPRKRLATACLDCREKKIKCEPGEKSCAQCEKAMRPCRRAVDKIAPPDTPTNTLYFASSPSRKEPLTPEETRLSDRNPELESASKRRSRADTSPPLEPSKKHRDRSPRPSPRSDAKVSEPRDRRARSSDEISSLHLPLGETISWEYDPYEVEPEMTMDLLNIYFDHINNSIYPFFPRRHFFRWVQGYESKCQNERMVLYAICAAASTFAGRDFAAFGKGCATIVSNALASETGRFSIAAAQSKLLLAFYHQARGAGGYGWDYIGLAIRNVTNMTLNNEDGCLDDEVSRGQMRYEFAFSPQQLAECKRRTFWSVYLQDRFCDPTTCALKPEDIFARLPCSDEMYENSLDSESPYFTHGSIDSEVTGPVSSSQVAPIAWLLPVGAVWGDIIDFLFRSSHRSGRTYQRQYETFYYSAHARLEEWLESLPEYLQYNESNIRRSSREGYLQTFILIHVLYHSCVLKLNRYMRHGLLRERIIPNIRAANHHAHMLLQVVNGTQEARKEEVARGGSRAFIFSSPVVSSALMSAIDTVSAGGHDSSFKRTLEQISQSLSTLHDLTQYWNISKNHMKLCEKRFLQLQNILVSPDRAKSGCWMGRHWGIVAQRLEQDEPLTNDCIYGLAEREGDEASQMYFEAFHEG